jgi:antitoxin ParD1/3/4
MARQIFIDLDERSRRFIEEQVASGHYDSVDDLVRDGLRLLEDHQSRLEALRKALIEGENSGIAGPIDIDAFLANRRAGRQGQTGKRRS